MKERAFLALLALSLAACVPDKVTSPPVVPALSQAASSLTRTGQTEMIVRVYEDVGENRVRIEERQAACTVDSPTFSTRLTTPALVLVPLFDGDTTSLKVTCTFMGDTDTTVQNCLMMNGSNTCSYADATLIFKPVR